MKIVHISAEQLLNDSFTLALQILESGLQPDLVVGIWRGGSPIAIAVHEVLAYAGLHCDHMALHTSSYTGIGSRQTVQVQGMNLLAEKAVQCKQVLLVDDVFDSGQSMAAILQAMQQSCGDRMPQISIATPYYKPANNTTSLTPDFFLHETADWLVFPHELCGLEAAELGNKPGLAALAERLAGYGKSRSGGDA